MGLRSVAMRMASTAAPAAVGVGASPFVYQNTSTGEQFAIISGGTVSLVEYSRDGVTFFIVGLIAGAVPLNPSDRLRVTYAIAPTMTAVQIN